MALSQRAALMGDVPTAAGKVRPTGRREEQASGWHHESTSEDTAPHQRGYMHEPRPDYVSQYVL